MTSREAFEAWFAGKADTDYVKRQESIAWWTWQAAIAYVQRERKPINDETITLLLEAIDHIELRHELSKEFRRILGVPAP